MPTSDEIAAFYDSHPYPPAVDDLERWLRAWDDSARRVEHFRHWPTVPYDRERRILVAGCGTSQAARWAARYPDATVVGIDVSPSSLDAQRRLVDRYALSNVELLEMPIEEVATLGRSFDQVVCTGVLHHLADPTVGLRALRDVLEPEGAIQLMVYAAHGRYGITMLREYASRLGLQPDEDDLVGLASVLKELPPGHPMSHVLRVTPDFRDPGALADAVLNPREKTYTVPALFELLEAGGVGFDRWVRQAPYRPRCGIMRMLPHAERLAAMGEADQYAAMELFRGTITRHSLIAHRDDSPLDPLDWSGDDWREWVPMIPRTVVVVEDRLPEGMAAAVINRAHVDRDLVCFLDPADLAVFSSVDGQTPFGAVARSSRGLLERLWVHDLVMIDATGNRG